MAYQESVGLWQELQAWVCKSLSLLGPQTGPDPVNMPMIHHWVDAFDDRNPVYQDEEFAKSTRFGGVVAPQATLQTWTMARPILEGIAERGGAAVDLPAAGPLAMLDEAGFNATLATNSELEFIRPLRPGDLLSSDVILDSVSPQKKTGLGRGYFVTWISNYRDQAGEPVGRQTFRVLKFNPLTMGEAG